MSNKSVASIPVIEWSPQTVRGYDPAQGQIFEAESLAQLCTMMRNPKTVGLAISRRQSFIRTVRLPNVSKHDALAALALQIDQYFPIPSEELAYDFIFHTDQNMDGRQALLAAVRTNVLEQAFADLKANGMKAKWVVPAAFGTQLALANLGTGDTLFLEPSPEGLCVDAVKDKELIYSRVGGSRDMNIDIPSEIARTLATTGITNPEIVTTSNLNYPDARQLSEPSGLLHLATHESAKLNIELPYVRAQAESKKIEGARRLTVLMACVAICAAAFVYLDRDDHSKKLQKIVDASNRKRISIENGIKLTESRVADATSGKEVVESAFNFAQVPSDVITAASNATPKDAWLTGITFERGKLLQIRGTATGSQAVAAYVSALTQSDRFRDVKLNFANNAKIEDTPVVQFSMTAHVVGNLPLLDKSKEKKKSVKSK